jgi:hypothetical protein
MIFDLKGDFIQNTLKKFEKIQEVRRHVKELVTKVSNFFDGYFHKIQ